jgi:putative flippase GtrA
MITFSKAQIASLLATGVDFGVTFLLLRWAGVPAAGASGTVTFFGALNASGLYLLTRYTGLDHMLAKVVTAVTVAVFFNYVLQKRFVFK